MPEQTPLQPAEVPLGLGVGAAFGLALGAVVASSALGSGGGGGGGGGLCSLARVAVGSGAEVGLSTWAGPLARVVVQMTIPITPASIRVAATIKDLLPPLAGMGGGLLSVMVSSVEGRFTADARLLPRFNSAGQGALDGILACGPCLKAGRDAMHFRLQASRPTIRYLSRIG